MKRREHRSHACQLVWDMRRIHRFQQPFYPRTWAGARIRIKVGKNRADVVIPFEQLLYDLRNRAAGTRTQIDDLYGHTGMKNCRDLLRPSLRECRPHSVGCCEICRFRIAQNSWKPRLISEFEQVQSPHFDSLHCDPRLELPPSSRETGTT